ncbi:putative T7SS-secreted protein [Streptomyces sp. KL116D]|uniref:putative T7SS-secreted protein n=1 Tax=Streptomyces sp. KL116D TaxID=3045152 RepID=UPI003557F1C4
MAASLGSTDDPKALIPGDAGKLGDIETALGKWSDKFEKIGDGLRDLRIKGWVGAASDVFWPTLGKEKTNWYFASDAMSGAAKAIHSYCSTLTWAQGQAGNAIDKWKADDHEGAEQVLDGARKQLKEEAEKLTKKLNELAGSAKDSPDWLVAVRSGVDAKKWWEDHGVAKSAISPTAWTRENKKWVTDEASHWRQSGEGVRQGRRQQLVPRNKAEQGEDGDPTAPGKKADWNIKLAEWSGNASAWKEGVSDQFSGGGFKGKYAAEVSALGVRRLGRRERRERAAEGRRLGHGVPRAGLRERFRRVRVRRAAGRGQGVRRR